METERPIEKLLRACVNKRQAEAGDLPVLHPATRRLLHGEIARQFPASEAGRAAPARPKFWLWPRLAWGVVAFAVVAIAAVLWLPPLANRQPDKMLMAKNEMPARGPRPPSTPAPLSPKEAPALKAPASTVEKETAAPAPPAPVNAPATVLARPQPQSESFARLDANQLAAAKSDLSGAEADADAKRMQKDKEVVRKLSQAATESEPASKPAATANLDRTENFSLAIQSPDRVVAGTDQTVSRVAKSAATGGALMPSRAGGVTQQFVQMPPAANYKLAMAEESRPSNPILSSFQFQQSGQDLRVIDHDGSVYTGSVEPATEANRRSETAAQNTFAAKTLRSPQAQARSSAALAPAESRVSAASYLFRVAGTNRTLKQMVVFTGSLLPATNALGVAQVAGSASADGGLMLRNAPTAAAPAPAPLLESRISGKAVIDGRREFEVNAVAQPWRQP
jgi:hypothetical protein